MDNLKENIVEIAARVAENLGFFLIDVNIRGNNANRIIEVYVDGEVNVSADNCAEISRNMNSEIEEKDLIKSAYRLDISSPGVDRPLIYLKQYPKHINRKFEIIYQQESEEQKLTGKLINIQNDDLTFLVEGKREVIVSFNSIKKANVIISFS